MSLVQQCFMYSDGCVYQVFTSFRQFHCVHNRNRSVCTPQSPICAQWSAVSAQLLQHICFFGESLNVKRCMHLLDKNLNLICTPDILILYIQYHCSSVSSQYIYIYICSFVVPLEQPCTYMYDIQFIIQVIFAWLIYQHFVILMGI